MKVGDWIVSPFGDQYKIVFAHPCKDEFLLVCCDASLKWVSTFNLMARYKLF